MQPAFPLLLSLVLSMAASTQSPPPIPVPANVVREGRITDVLGEPIVGATVEAMLHGRVVARSAADAEGIYLLRLPRCAELQFAAAGREPARLPWRGETAPRVHNVVLEDAACVRGTVRDAAGTPARGAAVVLLAGNRSHSATTDEAGAFALPAVPLRAAVLFVSAGRHSCERTLHVRDDSRIDLVLAPTRAGRCLVRVQGLPAAAIAGAALRVFGPDPLALQSGGVPLRADGSAEFELANLSLVQVVADGFLGAPDTHLIGPRSAPVTFTAAPPAARTTMLVRGTVRTTLGKPLAGVRVLVRDRSHRELGLTLSAANGAFQLPLPLGAEHTLRCGIAIADGVLADPLATVLDNCSWQLFDGSGAIDLLVEPSVAVQTSVRLDDGTHLALAEIVVGDPLAPHRTLLHTNSDRAGAVAFGLPVGQHELLAIGHGGAVCAATFDLRTSGGDAVQWRRIATGEIAGRLLAADGAPLPGVELLLAHEDLQRVGTARSSERQRITIVTDRSGAFRCRGMPTGTWTVVALHEASVQPDSCLVAADAQSVMQLRGKR